MISRLCILVPVVLLLADHKDKGVGEAEAVEACGSWWKAPQSRYHSPYSYSLLQKLLYVNQFCLKALDTICLRKLF